MKEFVPAIPYDKSFPPPVPWFEVFGFDATGIFPDGIQLVMEGFEDGK